ncbi:MAG: hypothetical protein QM579_08060 [Desulfovibrio sp.]|uniref:hypothetical protein n=1 Tax=Desulfovibrio sp. TaxID=885 RepID=UPI0039E719BF
MDQATLVQKIDQLSGDIDLLRRVVHGTETETVSLGGVSTPSVRKMMADIDVRESQTAQIAIAQGTDAAIGQCQGLVDIVQAYANDIAVNTHESVAVEGQVIIDVTHEPWGLAQSLNNIEVFIDRKKLPPSALSRVNAKVLSLSSPLSEGARIELRSASFNPAATSDAVAAAANAAATAQVCLNLADVFTSAVNDYGSVADAVGTTTDYGQL